jgi:hypothetical protein
MNRKSPASIYATLMLHRGKHMESIWVRKLRGTLHEVMAVPFFANNISLGGVVSCSTDSDGEGLFIDKVVKKSGNRTVRIAFKAVEGGRHREALKLTDYFKKAGLQWDYNGIRVFSVNIRTSAQ